MKFTKQVMASAVLVTALGATALPLAAAQAAVRDCNANADMYCGAYSKTELNDKLASGDSRHTASNLQQIYFNEGRGITKAGIQSAVLGTVYKDGRVVVGGKVVATGAMSTGRSFIAGSTKSGSLWQRPTSVSFLSDSISAYVNMDGGTFHWAILQACGNTVSAKPVSKPTPTPTPKPTPTPTVTPTPTPTPTPTVTPTPTPTPTPLPDTGATGLASGALGLTAMGLTGRSYLRSRRANKR